MAKPELGTKRVCPSCGTKYYDLHRNPIVCPSCGTVFVVAPAARAPERKAEPVPKAPVAAVAAVDLEPDVEIVSLEEVEEEGDADVGPDVDGEDEEPVVPDVEIEVEEAEGDDAVPDPFLEEEEEGGDDVAGLLDVDQEQEEER